MPFRVFLSDSAKHGPKRKCPKDAGGRINPDFDQDVGAIEHANQRNCTNDVYGQQHEQDKQCACSFCAIRELHDTLASRGIQIVWSRAGDVDMHLTGRSTNCSIRLM